MFVVGKPYFATHKHLQQHAQKRKSRNVHRSPRHHKQRRNKTNKDHVQRKPQLESVSEGSR